MLTSSPAPRASTGGLIPARYALWTAAATMAPQRTSLVQIRSPSPRASNRHGAFRHCRALGPFVGGSIVHTDLFGQGWRPIFLINIPAGLGALFGSMTLVRRASHRALHGTTYPERCSSCSRR